jgi:2-polyprenyl-6-hydroxyphenyl methylase/3-demethylubiquinone-9 3-methyltransferase
MKDIIKKHLAEFSYYGIDLNTEELSNNKKYDMIICADVIEHLTNPDNLLNIISNHISENGIIILSTPDRDMRRGLNNLRSPNKAHVREWNKSELSKYLSSFDFKIINHINLPLKNLNSILFYLSQNLLYKKVYKDSWFACQVATLSL